ncbi:MAG: TlpA family protein disulfide reductase [Bacteroidetes bacterium]|nr:TlpA family protein disulfide reductase [Bacteroidota bacterium]
MRSKKISWKFSLRLCAFACIFLVVSGASVYSQEIKKIKIAELEAYIRQSDHPLIVNFWATFCVPCVKEIPAFQAAVEKNKNVELLLVSLDLPKYYPEKISSFAKEKNFTANISWLNETNADYFCPKIDKKWSGAIPSSLFVNSKTKYRRFFAREMKGEEIEKYIAEMVK